MYYNKGYNTGYNNGYISGLNVNYSSFISTPSPTPSPSTTPTKLNYNIVDTWEQLISNKPNEDNMVIGKGGVLYSTEPNPLNTQSEYSHGWYRVPSDNTDCVNTVYNLCHNVNTHGDSLTLDYADSKICGGNDGGCKWFQEDQVIYFNCFANGLHAINPKIPNTETELGFASSNIYKWEWTGEDKLNGTGTCKYGCNDRCTDICPAYQDKCTIDVKNYTTSNKTIDVWNICENCCRANPLNQLYPDPLPTENLSLATCMPNNCFISHIPT